MVTIEEAMQEAQVAMQHIIDERAAQAERDNMCKFQAFLIGDCYEQMAAEKIANLEALHNA